MSLTRTITALVPTYPRPTWPWAVIGALIALMGAAYYALSAPADFSPSLVVISHGSTTRQITDQMGTARVIRNPLVLEILLRAQGKSQSIPAGVYRFETPQSLVVVARRLMAGDSGMPQAKLTFFEGITAREITERVMNDFPHIPPAEFASAKQFEGYLFPDTYFFPSSSTAASIVKTMRENFDSRIAGLTQDIAASGRSISDIVTMASLVEKEARTPEDRRIIAGILWKRLELGMPLQVDAVFGYIKNRDTYSPSLDDLTIDSPYNTYKYPGLPPGPIANPGLDSILSVLHPTKTNYLYYLTGNDGLMRYAKTFPAHQANKRMYLN